MWYNTIGEKSMTENEKKIAAKETFPLRLPLDTYRKVSDVQQEVNGLLYADRTPKFNLQKIKKITVNEK